MRLANSNCPNDWRTDMPRYFDDHFQRHLRNDISWELLLTQLRWPHKQRQGQLAFLCPRCHEYLSAVNPRTNLGRCFYCQTNFNPIDFTMVVEECDFVTAVGYLKPLLSRRRPPRAPLPAFSTAEAQPAGHRARLDPIRPPR